MGNPDYPYAWDMELGKPHGHLHGRGDTANEMHEIEMRPPSKVGVFATRGQMERAVNSPPHYTNGKVETIDVIEQIIASYPSVLGWSIGQVVKYVSRAPLKNNLLEDLKKARWYLDRAIQAADDTRST